MQSSRRRLVTESFAGFKIRGLKCNLITNWTTPVHNLDWARSGKFIDTTIMIVARRPHLQHNQLFFSKYACVTNTYILLTKREGRTAGRILARGLDSTDLATLSTLGPYKKGRGPIFSQYGPEQAWSIRDLLHD